LYLSLNLRLKASRIELSLQDISQVIDDPTELIVPTKNNVLS